MLGIEVFVWIGLFIILGMIGSWVISIKDYVRELEVELRRLSSRIEIENKLNEILRENKEWKERNR